MVSWQDCDSSSKGILECIATLYYNRDSPPIYRLAAPEMTREPFLQPLAFSGATVVRRADSGVLEFNWSAPQEGRRSNPRVLGDYLARVAQEEDNRRLRQVLLRNTEVVLLELESLIEELNIPVIGPGGRVTLYAGVRDADIVIRERVDEVPSQWRDPEDVEFSIREQIPQRLPPSEIHMAFGYFELSKYERQAWMRPSIIAVVDRRPEGRMPGWRHVIVEPATVADQIPDSAGLGSWSDREGGLNERL